MAIRGFIASSLDGYVADKFGSIKFLHDYELVDYGYDSFITQIGTVVLGRATYDQIPSLGIGWPYPGKRGIVVTSQPLNIAYEGVEVWSRGIDQLVAELRRDSVHDAWIVGGPKLQSAFVLAEALDRLDLFVLPVMLGQGVPLFPSGTVSPRSMQLRDVTPLAKSMVRLSYAFV